jgi:toxin-antitoxin system PIN domain toxin
VFVVDTNVLVHAVDAWSPFHASCSRRLEQWREQTSAWFLTWPIVYEFLRVSSHRSVLQNPFSLPQAWRFVSVLLKSPALGILVPSTRHSEVAEEVFAELPDLHANLVHDAATAILMREHGIRRIMTRDTDFHRFPFLEVVDPIR